MAKESKFESCTCGRCGGTGEYSFNPKDGTMCYGCSGSGRKFTKRGAVAQKYFAESMTVLAEDLKVGDAIRFHTTDKYFRKISHLDRGNSAELESRNDTLFYRGEAAKLECIYVVAENGIDSAIFFPGMRVRLMQSDAEKKAKLAAALEYQNTLTLAGQPRKTRIK